MVKHTLKKCDMMKRYFSKGAQGNGDQDKKPKGSRSDDGGRMMPSLSSTTAS
jgi:hypothetical protein